MAYVSVSEIFSSLNEEDFRNYLSGCGNGAEADDIMSALKEIRSLKGKTPDRGVYFIFFHYDDTRERYFHETRRKKLLSEIFSPRHTDFTPRMLLVDGKTSMEREIAFVGWEYICGARVYKRYLEGKRLALCLAASLITSMTLFGFSKGVVDECVKLFLSGAGKDCKNTDAAGRGEGPGENALVDTGEPFFV